MTFSWIIVGSMMLRFCVIVFLLSAKTPLRLFKCCYRSNRGILYFHPPPVNLLTSLSSSSFHYLSTYRFSFCTTGSEVSSPIPVFTSPPKKWKIQPSHTVETQPRINQKINTISLILTPLIHLPAYSSCQLFTTALLSTNRIQSPITTTESSDLVPLIL